MKERVENLTPILCRILRKMDACGKLDVHVSTDLILSHSEFGNYPKLSLFGLITKGEGAGCWRITSQGFAFLKGVPVIRSVKVIEKRVKLYTSDKATIYEILKEEKDLMKKADYQKQSVQAELFR